ncbi:TetR family transcriptional regulator [Rhodococcus sp. TAF43]|uniref:TetR family transcriptional regulator n=1 Tax=unclassified Rhodococcus (in: high G+C Gram-positive bacteria) TaxID=192944 RepID=UPI000E0B95A5|nr:MULTISPECIES: TetR family transcriptional regulator [unclassified Rhodococcus (in: high G+C Gram-positive bacteria)]QKT14077.1 TetR/AcrR family transcriptional regulator [Rhodococcus sp. W8901]
MSPDDMTDSQRERRRHLLDTVIAMLAETSPDRIQMREVSERSGVALGTLYRYFPAKQHLLAASMVAWNDILAERLAEEKASGSRSRAQGSVLDRVVDLYSRQMKAFQRGPNFARLEVELQTSDDPYVRDTLDERSAVNRTGLFELMDGVPAERARLASLSIGSTMLNSLVLWTTGRIGFPEALRNVQDVSRLVLADYS